MIANAIPAPAAAQINVNCRKLQAANSGCYAVHALSGFRVHFQYPRARRRIDNLIVLARSKGEALDRANVMLPDYLPTGMSRL
ncbi:hypothetical protein B0T37_10695 [Chromobacterium violaceum]|uniref:hypothetical protein n=1 Tax=Chromobacterium violaceum TaxID=536 RepID=UPI0009D98289|nr:hypothetical protein [Chromobacterium violaceum]OQS10106.1 hypothetical protein B0T38_11090 [Chromobacterium violaceum]OQS26521.1 hypothetical protein B0T37_10695 [Chromobacterium violaceum]